MSVVVPAKTATAPVAVLSKAVPKTCLTNAPPAPVRPATATAPPPLAKILVRGVVIPVMFVAALLVTVDQITVRVGAVNVILQAVGMEGEIKRGLVVVTKAVLNNATVVVDKHSGILRNLSKATCSADKTMA
jgi:hypothetical protein